MAMPVEDGATLICRPETLGIVPGQKFAENGRVAVFESNWHRGNTMKTLGFCPIASRH